MNPPRPKRGCRVPRQSPFPISIGSVIGHTPTVADWSMCVGQLHGNSVVVSDQKQKEKLFYSGFFGKGSLSRGINNIQQEQHASEKIRIMSRRLYDYHQSWNDISSDVGTSGEADESAVVQVRDDSDDSEDVDQEKNDSTKMTTEFKNDPHPLTENLYLSTPEAFFLSYGLGCLLVMDEKMKYLNLEEMWSCYSDLDSTFIFKYVAYHHFRSKGWIVRAGIKFGVDFLLYKEGPPFYHSSYSVIVKYVVGDDLQPVNGTQPRPASWSELAGICRINEHAAKEVMFCYVIQPSEVSSDDLKHPTCVSHFKVQEILTQRWVAAKERESGNLSD